MNKKENKWSQDLFIKAYKFAAEVHDKQIVPGTNISYIMHLSFVSMEIIAALNFHPECDGNLAVQCALLHDTIEDGPKNNPEKSPEDFYKAIEKEFGRDIADGVLALSKDKSLEKPEQMLDCLERIKKQPEEIWMVKMADRITNLQPPPGDWSKEKIREYMEEAITIHKHLAEASEYLSSRLLKKIEEYRRF